MVPSCTEDIKDMSSDANTITPELQEPSLKRIQVSDALAEQLAAEPQNAAAILGSSAVKSVSPTFYIGGEWEAKQREFGLHQWFDVEFAQDAAVTKAATELSSVPGVILVEDVQMITSKAMNDPKLKDQYALGVPGQIGDVRLPPVVPFIGQRWGVYNDWKVKDVEKSLGYNFAFEENDGYDTDHDGRSDQAETAALSRAIRRTRTTRGAGRRCTSRARTAPCRPRATASSARAARTKSCSSSSRSSAG